MNEYPTPSKKLIRHYVRVTYEEELRRTLAPPAAKCDDWRTGSLRSGELSVAIHESHNRPQERDVASKVKGWLGTSTTAASLW